MLDSRWWVAVIPPTSVLYKPQGITDTYRFDSAKLGKKKQKKIPREPHVGVKKSGRQALLS